MKTTIILFIVLVLSASGWAKYSGGTGEPNEPYLIATPEDLNSIGLDPCDWDKHFKMTADINLADGFERLNPIGYFTCSYISSENKPFSGVFDGNGHSISNFTCRYEEPNRLCGLALFAYVSGENAEIKNLGIAGPCIYGGSEAQDVGALVGVLDKGKISNCYIKEGTVHGESTGVAGLVGNNGGMIRSCWVIDCTVAGDGLVGTVTGANSAMGLYAGEIKTCFARGTVQGSWRIGGLVGVNKGRIESSYAICEVNGQRIVGGLVGDFFGGEILRSYSASKVTGSEDTGAFSGYRGYGLYNQLDKCFWDSQLNPGLPGNSNGIDPNLTGLPTAQMQMRATFADAGWDMVDIWDIGENQTYPFLRTHLPSDINKDDETNLYDLAILAQNWLAED